MQRTSSRKILLDEGFHRLAKGIDITEEKKRLGNILKAKKIIKEV